MIKNRQKSSKMIKNDQKININRKILICVNNKSNYSERVQF